MKVFKRKAIKNWSISAENGDTFELEAGKVYTTSDVHNTGDEDYVVVFSTFWVQVPLSNFDEESISLDEEFAKRFNLTKR